MTHIYPTSSLLESFYPLIVSLFIGTATKSLLGNSFLERFYKIIYIEYKKLVVDPPHESVIHIHLHVTSLLVSLFYLEYLLQLILELAVTRYYPLLKLSILIMQLNLYSLNKLE